MGNCPSSFRAQFKPDHENSSNCQTDIILTPVTEKNEEKSCENSEDKTECDAEVDEVIEHSLATSNGTTGTGAEMNDSRIPLKVEDVDLHIDENTSSHHTSNFNIVRKTPSLILRRGFPFHIDITFNRPTEQEKDLVCIVFTVKGATHPSYAQGTQVFVPLQLEDNFVAQNNWRAKIISSSDKTITAEVTSSPSSVVGEWTVEIDTKSKDDLITNGLHYKLKNHVTLLFNPWCEGDSVYLSEPEYCEEYVMNDSGLIWRGTHNRLRQCVWNFAQFEENILECCLYLLNQSGSLPAVERADPVLVIKHIASMVNSKGSTGVLVGNFTGNYKGGILPTSWTGSQQILQKFYKSKKPIKYAQCWVYAGILTTVCRALGIPSRPVTNYLSAQDTHNSMIADYFIGNENQVMDNPNSGSVWSFHVWTEAWMQRPDLEPGNYGGWQAVDAAVQGGQNGCSQAGPASVAAIRRGEIKKPFNTSVLYTEVNAEKVYWRYYGQNQPLKLMKTSTQEVGHCISTKAVGKFDREDITHEYKDSERELKQRNPMLCSLIQNRNEFTRLWSNDDFRDVNFEFSLPDDVVIGDTFSVKLKTSNKHDEKSYTLKIDLRVDSALYTGKIIQLVKRDTFEIPLAPSVDQEMTMNVEYSEYAKALSDQCVFNVSASAHVIETGFDFFAQDDFRVRMPHISLQVDGEISQNHPLTITASFTNPLPIPLQKGVFVIEGPGFGKPLIQKFRGNVQSKADAKAICKVMPQYPGRKNVVVKFHSKELVDVEGYYMINVKSNDTSEKESNSHL